MFDHIKRFTKQGFVPSTKRKALPLQAKKPMSTAEQFAALMRSSEFTRRVREAGLETFEEADDFNIADDPVDNNTPYETDFDLASAAASHHGVVQPISPEEIIAAQDLAARARIKAAEQKAAKKAGSVPPNPDGGSGD